MGRARVLSEIREMRFEDFVGRLHDGHLTCDEAALGVLGIVLAGCKITQLGHSMIVTVKPSDDALSNTDPSTSYQQPASGGCGVARPGHREMRFHRNYHPIHEGTQIALYR